MFQCSGDDMNLVLTGGVTPATSPKVLSPGTLVPQPPPAAAAQPRALAQHIAQQSLLARQHENFMLASLRPPVMPMLPLRLPSPQPYTLPQMSPMPSVLAPAKRTFERAFGQHDPNNPKRAYALPPPMQPALSLPFLSYSSTNPIFSYANSNPVLTNYANALQSALPPGYGTALSAALPPTLTTPYPGAFSMLPHYPYYPGM